MDAVLRSACGLSTGKQDSQNPLCYNIFRYWSTELTKKMEITSVHNPRVKEWAQLLDKKGRDRQGRYIVEGVHLVQEALRAMAPLEHVLYSLERGLPSGLSPDDAPQAAWIGVSEAVLRKCTDTPSPQPVAAIVRKQPSQLEQLWNDPAVQGSRQAYGNGSGNGVPLVVVVDGVQDPGNLGTIIRSADAAGATGVLIGHGSADLYNPKTVRSTMGSLFHLPIVEARLDEALPQAQEHGICLISAELGVVQNCFQYDWRRPTWIIVGNEANGVSDLARSYVNERVTIPMLGRAESLNAAMAATVLLYEAMRQRFFSPNKNSCP
jgi:TrmH family RNA methyltransferase